MFITWLQGLHKLLSAQMAGTEQKKLQWLLQIFRLADTAHSGTVQRAKLHTLMQYCNYDVPEEEGGASRRGSILRPMRLTPRRPKRAAPATATPLDEDGKPTVEGSISLVRNAMRLKPNISEKSEGKRGAKTGRGGGLATRTFSPAKSLSRRDRERTQTQRVHFRYFLRHVERASLLPPIVDLYRLALTFRPPQTVRAAGSTISHHGRSPACTPRRSWMRRLSNASGIPRLSLQLRKSSNPLDALGLRGDDGRTPRTARSLCESAPPTVMEGSTSSATFGSNSKDLSVSNSAGAFGLRGARSLHDALQTPPSRTGGEDSAWGRGGSPLGRGIGQRSSQSGQSFDSDRPPTDEGGALAATPEGSREGTQWSSLNSSGPPSTEYDSKELPSSFPSSDVGGSAPASRRTSLTSSCKGSGSLKPPNLEVKIEIPAAASSSTSASPAAAAENSTTLGMLSSFLRGGGGLMSSMGGRTPRQAAPDDLLLAVVGETGAPSASASAALAAVRK